MYGKWETISAYNMRRRLKAVRDKYDELTNDKEVHYRESEDPVTKELTVRIIPHIGVHPND